jgi:hypothetical protein
LATSIRSTIPGGDGKGDAMTDRETAAENLTVRHDDAGTADASFSGMTKSSGDAGADP